MTNTKIMVTPEGRDGIFVPDKDSLLDWVTDYPSGTIHCFIPTRIGAIGADWDKSSVVEEIEKSVRLAVRTGRARSRNMGHSLSVIVKDGDDEKLRMFDIGDIEEDLDIDATVMDK